MALTGAFKKTDRHTGPGQLQGHLNLRFLTGDTRVALGDQENEVMWPTIKSQDGGLQLMQLYKGPLESSPNLTGLST